MLAHARRTHAFSCTQKKIQHKIQRHFFCNIFSPPLQHTFKGLAVLLIDYLASAKVDGYADEVTISADLRLSQKNVRKALRYLESERLVAAESVKFSFKRRNAEEVDDPEVEERKRKETHVFWCIDYPRLVDTLRLKLHKVKETLKHQVEGIQALQKYICPRCGAQFSSLDAIALLDPTTGVFRCEDCGGELTEMVEGPSASTAGAGASSSLRERQTFFKDLLARFEVQLKPILDQLEKLREVSPPDYGPLQDWYYIKREEAGKRAQRLEAARRKVAAAGGALGAELTDEQLLEWAERAEVVVALPGQEGGAAGGAAGEVLLPGKELPAWFRVGGGDEGAASASVDHGGDGLRESEAGAAEQRRVLEQQYLTQYLAQVRQAQAEMNNGGGGAVGGGVEEKETKRMKVDEGEQSGPAAAVKERITVAVVDVVKIEQNGGGTKKAEEEGIEWEDAGGDAVKLEDGDKEEDVDWEDA